MIFMHVINSFIDFLKMGSMKEKDQRFPTPKELEKELGEYLSKKFGAEVRVISPETFPQEALFEKPNDKPKEKKINFNMKPEELVAYLDQYIIKQDRAKAVLATKICTHFNRIKYAESLEDDAASMVGNIKNNVLMIGPTGVGKTYMIKLIAKKIGVPFVKGDATKFSETGYVGGDVEDLVRDLVREADGNIELAQYGIIYIDEIDKIASSRNIIGADISRTGVQRALLKPMEETDVDLKVPHDPISVIQEIERYRKTGKRDKRTVNTKNILFIVSGAFSDLPQIINKRLKDQGIGFGSRITSVQDQSDLLKFVKAEDIIEFGFESEFIGRLPVYAVFEKLLEEDLYQILKNPNNPIILGKKIDFGSYGIQIKFEDQVLRKFAKEAFKENTGARGLVSVIERALLIFEKKLPSTSIRLFPVTLDILRNPEQSLDDLMNASDLSMLKETYQRLWQEEKEAIRTYIAEHKKTFSEKYGITLTPHKIDVAATYYCNHTMDVGRVIKKIKDFSDEIKKIELYFFKNHDINIVMEEDAIDYFMEQFVQKNLDIGDFYNRLSSDFEFGLKLVRDKTGRNRFFINRMALQSPEDYIRKLLQSSLMNKEGAERKQE